MPTDLIAALIVGAFTAGFTWLVYRARRRRPPRFLLPVLFGGGILGYAIWSEYSWAARTAEALPPEIVIVEELTVSNLWQPWTYLFPRINRLIAVDTGSFKRNEQLPGLVLIDLLLFERLVPTRRVIQIIDCLGAQRADVTSDEAFFQGVMPAGDRWAPLRSDSRLFRTVCGS